MRASRKTELAQQFPLHVVCRWTGNLQPAQPAASKHYLQATDADYARAVGKDTQRVAIRVRCNNAAFGCRNRLQAIEPTDRHDSQVAAAEKISEPCTPGRKDDMTPTGFEPVLPA